MKRRVIFICAPDDDANDAEFSAATDFITAVEKRHNRDLIFSGHATRPTLKSALRLARRVRRITGCTMLVQRRSGKQRERTWLVREENYK